MEAVAFLAAVVALGVATQKIVEFIRGLWTINGNITRLVALAVGTLLAYAFNLDPAGAVTQSIGVPIRDFPPIVDYVIGGVFISSAAGYLADRAGRSNNTVAVNGTGTVVVNNGGVAQHGAESHTNE